MLGAGRAEVPAGRPLHLHVQEAVFELRADSDEAAISVVDAAHDVARRQPVDGALPELLDCYELHVPYLCTAITTLSLTTTLPRSDLSSPCHLTTPFSV